MCRKIRAWKSRQDAGGEQRRKRCTRAVRPLLTNLVHGTQCQTASGQNLIEPRNAKRQMPTIGRWCGYPVTCPQMRQIGRGCVHENKYKNIKIRPQESIIPLEPLNPLTKLAELGSCIGRAQAAP